MEFLTIADLSFPKTGVFISTLSSLFFLFLLQLNFLVYFPIIVLGAQTVLCALAEVVNMRFVNGVGPRPGIMGIDYPTAFWLYMYVINMVHLNY